MPAASLLTLLDDIASVLDDVSVMTKIAAKKTAGVLGDDLALNAHQVSGVNADRELPVVWAVARGSLLNKAILVPAALLISSFVPWLVTPLMMLGGAYLCYEGVEKLAHRFLHSPEEDAQHHVEHVRAINDPTVDIVQVERDKIRGAIRTDFILSAEIIVITLGTVADASFTTRLLVLVGISLIMTVGVYGLVAGIVKLDDAGVLLTARGGESAFARAQRALGRGVLVAAPWLMKTLSVVGTAAMFLVGGGILAHSIPPLHHWVADLTQGLGGFALLASMLVDALLGILAGALVLLVVTGFQRLRRPRAA